MRLAAAVVLAALSSSPALAGDLRCQMRPGNGVNDTLARTVCDQVEDRYGVLGAHVEAWTEKTLKVSVALPLAQTPIDTLNLANSICADLRETVSERQVQVFLYQDIYYLRADREFEAVFRAEIDRQIPTSATAFTVCG